MSESPARTVEPGQWLEAARELREEGFTFFDFLTAVDETDTEAGGFEVVLHLYAVEPEGLRDTFLTTRVPDGELLPSLTEVWPGAAWHERETFEMFGIGFTDFVDTSGLGLRPLLLPDGFEGTPLRKSFVLTARVSKPWPGAKDPADASHGDQKGDKKPARAPRRRMQPPGIPDESWGPR
ncbi:NADH-quinone oxidoreductase subunit C [Calidifontibacter sp. DB0510]|uniref:NADH-quinone oxidoreductase subunit C n=1 Tax=Metallococcus carri TaxID=1656884 RepID=A0A967B5X8_9MICO|nr:NADH-quinone oxidoreductase subunit C [Metallococcus carri]NHN55241.1 NADH-quinone oxidoreductase subunit C [Metallococcus carri]NOP36318.1 NADH-quinone oxidoreductase subunit C [Calidifontibacter sp. DB2511S]